MCRDTTRHGVVDSRFATPCGRGRVIIIITATATHNPPDESDTNDDSVDRQMPIVPTKTGTTTTPIGSIGTVLQIHTAIFLSTTLVLERLLANDQLPMAHSTHQGIATTTQNDQTQIATATGTIAPSKANDTATTATPTSPTTTTPNRSRIGCRP